MEHDGNAKPVTVSAVDSSNKNIAVTINTTYAGSSTAPSAAGDYAVVSTISDSNYEGTKSATLTIGKVDLNVAAVSYSGAEQVPTLTLTPSDLSHTIKYNGGDVNPKNAGDYLRIFFARPGSRGSINQEQKNTLGNHLGVWDFSFKKKIGNNLFHFYYEHPFEDESGARWILNEFDGKYGFVVSDLSSIFISDFLYKTPTPLGPFNLWLEKQSISIFSATTSTFILPTAWVASHRNAILFSCAINPISLIG